MGLLDGTNQQEYYTGNDFGGYQFVSLEDIINQFMIIYVGEDKLISRARRLDVAFHAQRALAELSFDTFKCTKSQEITLPSSLTMMLPQDYVNYISLSWLDDSGIQHTLYPTSKTSNPTPILQNDDGDYALTAVGTLVDGSSSITLNSEYKNVLVGMLVSSPNIPVGSIVASTANASSITTITITDANGTDALATYSGDETLTFTPQDDSLIIEEESAFILENVTWSVNEDKITQSQFEEAFYGPKGPPDLTGGGNGQGITSQYPYPYPMSTAMAPATGTPTLPVLPPVQTANPENYGGTEVFLGLGMNINLDTFFSGNDSIGIEILKPINQNKNNLQMKTDYQVIIGYQKSI